MEIQKQPELIGEDKDKDNVSLEESYSEKLRHEEEKQTEMEKYLSVFNNLDISHGLDEEILLLSIEKGWGNLVVKNLDKFHIENYKNIVKIIIDNGDLGSLFFNMNKIPEKYHDEIARLIIENNQDFWLTQFIYKFQGANHEEIANILIKKGRADLIALNLDKFNNLSDQIAFLLIINKFELSVAINIKKFPESSHNKIAKSIIENGKGDVVTKYLNGFQRLNYNEIEKLLIENNNIIQIIENIHKFPGINRNEIAKIIISSGRVDVLVRNIFKFPELNNEIAKMIISSGKGDVLARNIHIFPGLNHDEIALILIKKGNGLLVAKNWYNFKFSNLNNQHIIERLITTEKYGMELAKKMETLQGVDIDKIISDAAKANKLESKNSKVIINAFKNEEIELSELKNRSAKWIVNNFDILPEEYYNEVAMQLIEQGRLKFVMDNLDKFQEIIRYKLIKYLLEKEPTTTDFIIILKNLDKFPKINHDELVKSLIEKGVGNLVANHFENFQGLNHDEIVKLLIDRGNGNSVAKNLNKFIDVDHNKIAQKLIEIGLEKSVIQNINKFDNLSQEIAKYFIEIEKIDLVKKYLRKFNGLDLEIFNQLVSTGHLLVTGKSIDSFDKNVRNIAERDYHLLSYQIDLGLESMDLYNSYFSLKKNNNQMGLKVLIADIKDRIDKLINSHKNPNDIAQIKYYRALVEHVYPNHAKNNTFESNESCGDRSYDLTNFVIKDKYEATLKPGKIMILKKGEKIDTESRDYLDDLLKISIHKLHDLNFDQEQLSRQLNLDLDVLLKQNDQKNYFTNQEEKIFGIFLEAMIDETKISDLKRIFLDYQLINFPNLQEYLEGTKDRTSKSPNPDYSYLLELGEFFSDRLKEVQKNIIYTALKNENILKLLPDYFQRKQHIDQIDQSKEIQNKINRLQLDKIGLEGNLLDRLMKILENKKMKLWKLDEKGNKILDKKGMTISGIISGEQKKMHKALKLLKNEDIAPEDIHLGEINLKEYMQAELKLSSNEFDKDLFEKYIIQIFQETFADELKIIDQELKKYTGEDTLEKQLKKLECFITKNHTSAHARGVAGVCVSRDNPDKNEICLWNMPNYFQMVLRDKDSMKCQGLILMHYYEEGGKKLLTASFNPSSTFLFKVDQDQLFEKLLDQLVIFAKDNGIDMILTSQNKSIRTNRLNTDFEKAIKNRISKIDLSFHFEKIENFSFSPENLQRDMDVIWVNDKLQEDKQEK